MSQRWQIIGGRRRGRGRRPFPLVCERLEIRAMLAADGGSVLPPPAAAVQIPLEVATLLHWSESIGEADLAAGVPIEVRRPGILFLEADPQSPPSTGRQLTLRDASGELIADLRKQDPGTGPLVGQFLLPGTYVVTDESPAGMAGAVDVRFRPSGGFYEPMLVGAGDRAAPPVAVISSDGEGKPIDVDGDGIPDLVVAHLNDTEPLIGPGGITFFTGTGDGHYVVGPSVPVGIEPQAVAVGRTGGANSPRLIVTANTGSDDISVLRQGPDGSFFPLQAALPVGRFPTGVALGDLDGDGLTDIVVANSAIDQKQLIREGDGSVTVLRQEEDGVFRTVLDLPAGKNPQSVAIARMDDDRFADIVVVNGVSEDVTILYHQADGGFRSITPPTPVGKSPGRVATADLDNDGRTDLVVVNSESDSVSILYQEADPTGPAGPFRQHVEGVGIGPWGVLVADVTGDQHLDIITADNGSNTVSVLAGGAKRSFAPVRNFVAGSYPVSVAAISGDKGRVDLVTADANDGTISFLRGLGEGDFSERPRTSTGTTPNAVEGVDVNADGRVDLITSNALSKDLSVLLGQGDGTFAKDRRVPLGFAPDNFHAADLNGDGRPDLLVLGNAPETIEGGRVSLPILRILLGLGDGTFGDPLPPRVIGGASDPGKVPFAIAVGNLNDDDLPDVVIAVVAAPLQDESSPTADPVVEFHTLLNRGNSFDETVAAPFGGDSPGHMILTDVDRDGHEDLVVTNDVDVAVLFGDGHGHFPDSSRLTAGLHPGPVVVADMDGDAWPDIVVANLNDADLNQAGDVSVLRQLPGQRTFTELLPRSAVEVGPLAIVVGEFSGDTFPDVIVANALSKSVSALPGIGGGHFAPAKTASLGTALPSGLAVADIDGDRKLDLIIANAFTNVISQFVTTRIPTLVNTASQDVELIRDASGVPSGVLSADRQGLLRLRSLRGASSASLPPAEGKAFASTLVPAPGGGVRIASIDVGQRSITIAESGPGKPRPPERLFAAFGDKRSFLSRIVATDLDGNGWGDLLVTDPGAGTVDFLLADGAGKFDDRRWESIAAGSDTSEILIGDLDGDRVPDLLTSDQGGGSMTVRYGVGNVVGAPVFTAASGFGTDYRLRTSRLGYEFKVDPLSGLGTPVAPFKLTDIALGDVTGDGLLDIVAVNAQAHSFSILAGLPGGGFSAPQEHLVRIPLTPAPVVARTSIEVQVAAVGDFDGDAQADIAFLDRPGERIVLYLTRDNPTFDQPGRLIPLAGNVPRSLLASDVAGPKGVPDGVLDLVIGNDYGDVLVLQGQAGKAGRGNGQFESLVRADKSVALLAADMDGDGIDDFVYGNKALDRITMVPQTKKDDVVATKEAFRADQASGVIGPSAVATVNETVAGQTIRNLVVANGGGNEILLFSRNMAAAAGSSDLFLAPQRFFVGSNPSALAVADVDADGISDVVVANTGSNDLSVMLGTIGADGRWTMKAGPRLQAGGANPAGIALGDFVRADGSRGSDGTLDIAVTTPGSNSANILAGRGGGFFNDRLPLPLVLPPDAIPGPIVPLPGGIGIGNLGNATITIIDVTRSGVNQEFFASRSYSSGGSAPTSMASMSSGGQTFLGVGNAGGSVSLFLGRPGSLDFSLKGVEPLSGVTSVAFNAAGRLYGMGPGQESALKLFDFAGSAPSGSSGSSGLAAISAAVAYFPLRASTVALVATIVSSGALVGGEGSAKTAPSATGRTGDRSPRDGAAGEEAEGEEEEQPPEEEAEEAEDPAVAKLLKLFLDIESTLRASNRQLLDRLLEGAEDPPAPSAGGEAPAAPAEPAASRSAAPTPLLQALAAWWSLTFTGEEQEDDRDRPDAAEVDREPPEPRPPALEPGAAVPSAASLWGGLLSGRESGDASPAPAPRRLRRRARTEPDRHPTQRTARRRASRQG